MSSTAADDSKTFKKGDVVNVINMRGHTFCLEGRATIVRKVRGVDSQYVVRFQGAHDGDETYERFIDPRAQGDNLDNFLAELNGADRLVVAQ